MNKFWVITKVQLKEIIDFRKMFNKQNKVKSASFLGLVILFIALFGFISVVYNLMFAFMLNETGNIDLLPGFMFVIASLMTLFTTMFKVKGTIFGSKDYETLQSLPIKSSTIVTSKIFILYLYELIFTLIILIPANILYCVLSGSWLSLITLNTIMFVVPIIPVVIASSIGFLISIISERIKYKNIIQIFLYIILIVGIMFISMQTSDSTQVTNIAQIINDKGNSIYPLMNMYIKGFVNYNIIFIVAFLLINLLFMLFYILIVGKNYKRINQFVLSIRTSNVYVEKSLDNKGQFHALFKKEITKYFHTPIYVMNTFIGGLMSIGLAILLLVKSDILFVEGFEELITYFSLFAPVLIAFIIGMSTTTCVSISLEGNNFWIIKSAPIDYRKYYLAKIAVNQLVLGISGIITAILLAIAFKMTIYEAIMLTINTFLFTLLTAILGLIINFIYPKMKWSTEQAAVKNSAAMILAMLADGAISLIILVMHVAALILGVIPFVSIIYFAFLILLIILFSQLLLKNGEKWINKIEA